MSTERPSWMEGGAPKVKQPRSPLSPSSHTAQNIRYAEERRPVSTTHRNVVVGITILAAMALLSTWFWLGFLVSVIAAPPRIEFFSGSSGDYWSIGRLFFCLVVSILGSLATWHAVDNMVE